MNLTSFHDQIYLETAFDDTDVLDNPDHDVQVFSGHGLSVADLWQQMSGSDFLLASGSMEDVGKQSPMCEWLLEPNLDSQIVRNVTSVFKFLIIQTLNGNPDAEKMHGILNCFSMQSFAWALMLAARLKEGSVDFRKIQDVDDMERQYPIEQTAQDTIFPIIRNPVSQLGIYSAEVDDPEHWLFDGDENVWHDLLFLHNQSVYFDVFIRILQTLEQLHVISSRVLNIKLEGFISRCRIVTGLAFNNMIGLQPHVDYGPSGAAYARHALKPNLEQNPNHYDGVFYPGNGGCETGTGEAPQTAYDLKKQLLASNIAAPFGQEIKRRVIHRALKY